MTYFALTYEYGPDYFATRDPYKQAHLDHLNAAATRGEVAFAGAAMDESKAPFGFVLFQADAVATVEDFARTDPYVTSGVSKSWKVRPWYGVTGPGAMGA